MPASLERRGALRFPIALPVKVKQWIGTTRNISTSGLFFETDGIFSTGAPINLSLLLEPQGSGNSTCLYCHGRVVRAETQGEKAGFAVAFTSFQFRTLGGGGENP